MKGRLIFGGSFNPVHIGHMRLAIESLNLMSELIDAVEFLPSAMPPHKKGAPILPFDLRARMIRAAIAGMDGLICNELESRIPGPSYTFETLSAIARQTGSADLYFLMGSQDFSLLPEWYKGLRLPELCRLVIAPRGDYSKDEFANQAHAFWDADQKLEAGPQDECTGEQGWCIRLAGGSFVYLLPLPHLAISATRIRKLWLCKKNVDYLMPQPALEILNNERQSVEICWQENTCSM